MIEVKNIYKQFGELEVLKGVSLTVQDGEIVSIIGKSGAGKTTLLQIIGTLETPTKSLTPVPSPNLPHELKFVGDPDVGEGGICQEDKTSIIINGVDVTTLGEKALAEFRNKHIGFIFQQHQLLPEFTAIENVMMPALIAGESQKEARTRAAELLSRLGLEERKEHKPNEMSGGEKQRVAAARAMMMNPSVILADEPTGSLDEHNKKELAELLLKMRSEFGQTIIIVTHDKDLAAISDRVVVMEDGELTGEALIEN